MTVYLADSSIWIGRRRPGAEYLRQLFAQRVSRSELATCVPVALEVLEGARSGQAYVRDWMTVWRHLVWLPMRERATGRALEVQSDLAMTAPGAQQLAANAYFIAACAEEAGPDVALWHWDDGLATICELTGQPHEFEHKRAKDHGVIA
jgi:predicted nucleic acid-binding protein